jgi:predicted O-methyltransferase YrrM
MNENDLFPKDIQGWGGTHPIFEKLIDEVLPSTIIEVGTWKGESALHMASILKNKNIKCKIYCIDTWLGGWTDIIECENNNNNWLLKKDNYPQIYQQFISNIKWENLEDYIVTCPNTSDNYYYYFKFVNLKADLIYIDGSHLFENVYNDIVNYSKLLNPNGIIFGDDFTFAPDVKKAVEKYCYENNKQYEVTEGRYWRLL